MSLSLQPEFVEFYLTGLSPSTSEVCFSFVPSVTGDVPKVLFQQHRKQTEMVGGGDPASEMIIYLPHVKQLSGRGL